MTGIAGQIEGAQIQAALAAAGIAGAILRHRQNILPFIGLAIEIDHQGFQAGAAELEWWQPIICGEDIKGFARAGICFTEQVAGLGVYLQLARTIGFDQNIERTGGGVFAIADLDHHNADAFFWIAIFEGIPTHFGTFTFVQTASGAVPAIG